ncbi:MAG: GNAT family protein [Terracidiphilus sp.]
MRSRDTRRKLNNVTPDPPILAGSYVRLEPLELRHIDGLVAAAAADPTLYQWSSVPQGRDAVARHIEIALVGRAAGTALPFATVRVADGAVIGSTRLFDVERWAWPEGHPRDGRDLPDVCEIGYTWLTRAAIRTAANTEAKLLMLTHAFEAWQVLRVCLHTDARNERSRAAIERIGGRFEGILRAHRMAADFIARDSARYSIVAKEWPEVKRMLAARLRPE